MDAAQQTTARKETACLWAGAALVSKRDAKGTWVDTVTGCYLAETEDEARGAFARKAAELKPGFAIWQIVCIKVPRDLMCVALGIWA